MEADFRLGQRIVRPQRNCIEHGDETVHVRPKTMAVLVRLAQADGQVVTRDELFDSVWPRGQVSDDTLTQCIVEIRKAFGDDAREPRVLETVPKTGFRLLLRAEVVDGRPNQGTDAKESNSRLSLRLLGAAAVLLLLSAWYGYKEWGPAEGKSEPPPKSIAVLPFADMSPNQDHGWYADSLSEELITRLAQVDGLQVAGRTSSFYFKGRNEDLRSIAEALDVSYLMEGSVLRTGDTLRVTAQLIDAKSGYHAWSEMYDREASDIFAVNREIVQAVAGALSIKLRVGELGTELGGTDNVEAWEALKQSRYQQWKGTPEGTLRAIDLLKEAIEIDPDYARAWLRLSGMYLNANSILSASYSDDWMRLSEEALERARELEPRMPALVMHIVMNHNLDRQWSKAHELMDGGAGLKHSSDFNLIWAWTDFLSRVGRDRDALPLFESLRRLNPYSPGAARTLARAYARAGRIEEAIAESERAFGLDGFKAFAVSSGLIVARASGDRDLVLKWLARAQEHIPEMREFMTVMADTIDEPDTALSYLREILHGSEDLEQQVAFWAAWHGDVELALDAMQQPIVPWSFWTNDFREVRQMPRFKEMVRQAGLEDYYREYGWNDYCRPAGPDDFECE